MRSTPATALRGRSLWQALARARSRSSPPITPGAGRPEDRRRFLPHLGWHLRLSVAADVTLSAGHVEREIPLASLASVMADAPRAASGWPRKAASPRDTMPTSSWSIFASHSPCVDDLQYRTTQPVRRHDVRFATETHDPARETVAIDGTVVGSDARPPGDACHASPCTFTGTWVSGTRRSRRDGVRCHVAAVLNHKAGRRARPPGALR